MDGNEQSDESSERARLELAKLRAELRALRRKTPYEVRKLRTESARWPPATVSALVASVLSAVTAIAVGILAWNVNRETATATLQTAELQAIRRFQEAAANVTNKDAAVRAGAVAALKPFAASDARAHPAVAVLVSAAIRESDPTVLDLIFDSLDGAKPAVLLPVAIRANRLAVKDLVTSVAVPRFGGNADIRVGAFPTGRGYDAGLVYPELTGMAPHDAGRVSELLSHLGTADTAVESIEVERLPRIAADTLSSVALPFVFPHASRALWMGMLVRTPPPPDITLDEFVALLSPKVVAVANTSAILSAIVNRADARADLKHQDFSGTVIVLRLNQADLRGTHFNGSVLIGSIADSSLEDASFKNVLGGALLVLGGSLRNAHLFDAYIAFDANARCRSDGTDAIDPNSTLPDLTGADMSLATVRAASPETARAIDAFHAHPQAVVTPFVPPSPMPTPALSPPSPARTQQQPLSLPSRGPAMTGVLQTAGATSPCNARVRNSLIP